MVWNCRGLRTAMAVRSLCDVVIANRPLVIGAIETKQGVNKWEGIKRKLGFRNCFVVPASDKCGGLALLWRDEVNLEIKSFSFYHVDATYYDGIRCRFTLYYGSSYLKFKDRSLNLINSLSNMNDLPWCIGEDFNEILAREDTTGAYDKRLHWVNMFPNILCDCGLFDLPFQGSPFTYSNRRLGSDEVKCRLDRYLVNYEWLKLFPHSMTHHLVSNRSDHCPILLATDSPKKIVKKQFLFEDMWFRDQNFRPLVSDLWHSFSSDRPFQSKLKMVSRRLTDWNKRNFGNVKGVISKLKRDLEGLRNAPRNSVNDGKEMEIFLAITNGFTGRKFFGNIALRLIGWPKRIAIRSSFTLKLLLDAESILSGN